MEKPQISENREALLDKFFLMRRVRFVAALCVTFWGLVLWFFGVTGFRPEILFSLTFIAMFVSQPHSFLIKRVKNLKALLNAYLIFDTILVTAGIYVLGGGDAYYAIAIYSLIIIFAGVIVSLNSSFIIASLCSLCYLTMVNLEFFGIIPKIPIFNFRLNPPLNLLVPLFNCTFFFLIAYVSSLLAGIITKKGEQSEEVLAKLKKAENTMVQAEKLAVVGQFATGIIHELKNPLGIIISGVEFLEKEIPVSPDATLSINKIKSSAIRANDIIRELLNFSRPSGQQLETVDLNVVLNDDIRLLKGISVDSNIQIVKEFSKNPIIVRLNSNQFEQVIFNIAVNAFDAMPAGGKVFMRTYTTNYLQKGLKSGFRESSHFVFGEKIAALEIQDEGTGIERESLDKVFDPFFTTKQKKENVGLGLSICRRIIDAHKGEIEIKSQPGKGTIVVIRLPLFAEKKKAA